MQNLNSPRTIIANKANIILISKRIGFIKRHDVNDEALNKGELLSKFRKQTEHQRIPLDETNCAKML